MDSLDERILNMLQGSFPVSEEPYSEIGRELGIPAAEALRRVRRLVEEGVIRKVGPFFDAKKMGHASTLCALDVPGERVDEVATVINAYPEVTHNYLRAGVPNIWFTVIAASRQAVEEVVREIERRCAVGPVRELPARRMFKVKVDLKVGGQDGQQGH